MTHLIDKDALVTEILKKLADILACKKDASTPEERIALADMQNLCKDILSFLDTLEVKEIDLEKELSYEDYTNFFKEHPDLDRDWGFDECWVFAKYFFELGAAKPQKGE